MECVKIGGATLYRGDSLEAMRKMPDNAFSLAIVDPPYRDMKDNQPTKDMRHGVQHHGIRDRRRLLQSRL
jgi:DNA modification methylase